MCVGKDNFRKTMKELRSGLKVKLKFDISPVRSYEISCTIKWVESDRISLIYPSDRQELMKFLFEGKEVEVVIYSDKGIFIFDSIVMDSPFGTDFIIELPEEKTKIQRREYIRSPIKLDFFLSKDNQMVKTHSVNVGGGGIRFCCAKEFPITDIWNFAFRLPSEVKPIKGSGEILYSIRQNQVVTSVIKFTEIGETERNKIIKACFEEEANRLKQKAAGSKSND
jgi:c-di-GMP-binding flagellar brake protein YcgR